MLSLYIELLACRLVDQEVARKSRLEKTLGRSATCRLTAFLRHKGIESRFLSPVQSLSTTILQA